MARIERFEDMEVRLGAGILVRRVYSLPEKKNLNRTMDYATKFGAQQFRLCPILRKVLNLES